MPYYLQTLKRLKKKNNKSKLPKLLSTHPTVLPFYKQEANVQNTWTCKFSHLVSTLQALHRLPKTNQSHLVHPFHIDSKVLSVWRIGQNFFKLKNLKKRKTSVKPRKIPDWHSTASLHHWCTLLRQLRITQATKLSFWGELPKNLKSSPYLPTGFSCIHTENKPEKDNWSGFLISCSERFTFFLCYLQVKISILWIWRKANVSHHPLILRKNNELSSQTWSQLPSFHA